MAVKIRLRMQGKKGRAFYRIIVADSRLPRDGKYIEKLGWYNPFDEEKKVELDGERLNHWLSVGAVLTPKAQSLAKQAQPEVLKKFLEKKPKNKPAQPKKEAAEKPVAKKAVKKAAKKTTAPKKKAASKE